MFVTSGPLAVHRVRLTLCVSHCVGRATSRAALGQRIEGGSVLQTNAKSNGGSNEKGLTDMDTVIFRSLASPPNEAQISVQLAHQPKHDPSSNTSVRVYIFNLNTKHFLHYHNTHNYQTSTHTD